MTPVETLVLDYHKTVEGEYGCPGLTCPGVQRLLVLAHQILDAQTRVDDSAVPCYCGTGDSCIGPAQLRVGYVCRQTLQVRLAGEHR